MAGDFETVLVVTQRETTTTLEPLQEQGILTLTQEAGLPGTKGDKGDLGNPGLNGQDGAASIPDILDGGNF